MVLSGIATAAVYVYFLAPPSLFVAWRRYVPLPDVLAASPAMPPLAPEDSPAHAWRAPDPVTVLGVVFVLQGITHSVSFVNGLLQTYLALWSNISWSVSAAAGDPNTVLILALHAVPGVLAILALVAAVLLLRRRPAGRILAIASAIAGLLIPVLPYVVIWLVRMPRVFVLEGLASHIRQATTLLVGLGTAAVYIYFLTRPVVREACAGSAWKAAA
jgi:hypothetical protein